MTIRLDVYKILDNQVRREQETDNFQDRVRILQRKSIFLDIRQAFIVGLYPHFLD